MRPGWAVAIAGQAVDPQTASRLITRLAALEDEALAFCRLLDRWAGGRAEPPTAGARAAALHDAAERVDRALGGLAAAGGFEASPDPGALWAGLFDLRENLLARAQDDVRALAA